MNPVAAAGFAAGVEAYERARPSYPADAVEWLANRLGLRPGRTVIDVAAGTGKLTRLLIPTGARVVAVEPVAEMRQKLVEVVPGVEALDGTAEELPLGDDAADAITVAQAMHWFDPVRALPELHRVLRPDGLLALVWNNRDLADPLQRGIEELLRPVRQSTPLARIGTWRGPLEASPLFGPLEVQQFAFVQHLTIDELCDRVCSTSFVAALDERGRAHLVDQVKSLAATTPEPFAFPYLTEVYVTAPR